MNSSSLCSKYVELELNCFSEKSYSEYVFSLGGVVLL